KRPWSFGVVNLEGLLCRKTAITTTCHSWDVITIPMLIPFGWLEVESEMGSATVKRMKLDLPASAADLLFTMSMRPCCICLALTMKSLLMNSKGDLSG